MPPPWGSRALFLKNTRKSSCGPNPARKFTNDRPPLGAPELFSSKTRGIRVRIWEGGEVEQKGALAKRKRSKYQNFFGGLIFLRNSGLPIWHRSAFFVKNTRKSSYGPNPARKFTNGMPRPVQGSDILGVSGTTLLRALYRAPHRLWEKRPF